MSTPSGFTVLEMLLVVAMVTVIAGSGLLAVRTAVSAEAVDTSGQLFVQSLRHAQISARSMRHDDTWGVAVSSGSATVFRGPAFAGRDEEFDEVFVFSRHVFVTGDTQIIFEKGTGLVSQLSSTSITVEDRTRAVRVHTTGAIDYE